MLWTDEQGSVGYSLLFSTWSCTPLRNSYHGYHTTLSCIITALFVERGRMELVRMVVSPIYRAVASHGFPLHTAGAFLSPFPILIFIAKSTLWPALFEALCERGMDWAYHGMAWHEGIAQIFTSSFYRNCRALTVLAFTGKYVFRVLVKGDYWRLRWFISSN